MTQGLIVGRFDPPHGGHVLLGQTAAALVDRLTILLVVTPADLTPAALRAQWLGELLPAAQIVPLELADRSIRTAALAERVRAAVAGLIDILFTGGVEDTGLAQAIGARPVQLDPGQRCVPVSSSDIREDPFAHWGFLPPPVRPFFAKTICLHGPESTGKSTLAPTLARHFDTFYLPEYGRTYCEAFGLALTMADLLSIGKTHAAMTRAALRQCNRRLILDTDPLMTAAWAEMLFERSDPWFEDFAETADFYVLLDIDLPWVDDGTRFFGDVERRRKFFDCSRDQLERRGLPYAIVSGGPEERLAGTLAAIAKAGLD